MAAPLANLFALADPDPEVLDKAEAAIRSHEEWDRVWRPAKGWVAGLAHLPGSACRPDVSAVSGLAWVEGRDLVLDSPAWRPEQVMDMARTRPAGLSSVPGDFGFVVFSDGGGATAVRSCGGLVPLHVRHGRGAGRAAIATRVGDLVQYVADEVELDPLVWGVWAAGLALFPDGRGFLRDTIVVPPGHAAVVGIGKPRIVRYFDPTPSRWPEPSTTADKAAELRDLLLSTLERDLDPSGLNLLTLSGGVDSSALGAIAVGRLGRRVGTLSIIPSESDPRRPRELGFIDSLADRYGLSARWTRPADLPLLYQDFLEGPEVCIPVLHPALCALPAVSSEAEISTLFGGEYADEVAGSAITFPDWAMSVGVARLPAAAGRLPFGRRDLLRWAAWRYRWATKRPRIVWTEDLPDFVAEEVRAEWRQWRADRLRRAAARPVPWRFLDLWSEHDGWVAMNWEVTSTLGIRRSIPFLSRGTIELVHRCHPTELIGPGTKKLLRTALDGLVPDAYVHRPDKGHWTDIRVEAEVDWDLAVPTPLAQRVLAPNWSHPPSRLPARTAIQLGRLVRAARRIETVTGCKDGT